MQKINDWDSVQASSDFVNLPVGGYVFKIVSVEPKVYATGTEYLEIKCDVAEGEFKDFANGNEKSLRRLRANYGGKSNGLFKRFIQSVIDCNRGFKWNWDENTLVGKTFCAVLVGREYWNSTTNKIALATEISYVTTMNLDKFKKNDYIVPAIEKIDPSTIPEEYNNASIDTEAISNEECPF